MKFTLRRACREDLEDLDNLYTENMRPLVERVAVWDPDRFRRDYQPQDFSVVEVAGCTAGLAKIVIGAEDIYIAEIQIQEMYRGRGIGNKLMQEVIALSEATGKRLWFRVVKDNPAKGFYEKYGFIPFRETATHWQMERVPAQSTMQRPVV